MKTLRMLAVSTLICLCGCVGGPTKDYYNPTVVGVKFGKPITITKVADVGREQDILVREGCTVIGSTDYGGKYPESKELKAQARRAGANHVIYSTVWVPATPGSWHFSFSRAFGSGGTGSGHHDVHIVFFGKPR